LLHRWGGVDPGPSGPRWMAFWVPWWLNSMGLW
jgi:hypothetical protein